MKQLNFNIECAGFFKVEAAKFDAENNEIAGSRRIAADWFPNLITNGGLDFMGTAADFLAACQVGSGSTTPAVTDVSLQTRIAGSIALQNNVNGVNNSVSPYYGWRRKTYRFAAGIATGNISELGIAPTTNGPVTSRALVLDGLGSPTTITILADEVLDVTYEFRLYVPVADVTGTFTLTTEGSVHDWTARAIDVDGGINTSWDFGLGIGFGISNSGAYFATNASESGLLAVTADGYSGSGAAAFSYPNAYVAGNYYRDIRLFYDLNIANFATGIGRIAISTTLGAFQYGFSPKIAKVATKKLTLNIRVLWSRRS